MIQVIAASWTHQGVQAHVRMGEGMSCAFNFPDPGFHHPGLQGAIDDLNTCIVGIVKSELKQVELESVPESDEGVKVGFCKMCSQPCSTEERGVTMNGPFLYCRKCNPW